MLHLMIWDCGLTYLHALPDLFVYELHISTVVWLIQQQTALSLLVFGQCIIHLHSLLQPNSLSPKSRPTADRPPSETDAASDAGLEEKEAEWQGSVGNEDAIKGSGISELILQCQSYHQYKV